MKILALAIPLLLVVGLLGLTREVIAQSKPPTLPKPNPNWTEQEKRGRYLFLQRCALCHLSKYSKSVSDAELPVVWRNLEGLFKAAKPEKEKAVREVILKGSQNMPGFQYALEPNELGDLIAFLKSL